MATTIEISYPDFRRRFVKFFNSWVKKNVDEDDWQDLILNAEKTDEEIFDAISYASTFGFMHGLRHIERPRVKCDFENVIFDDPLDNGNRRFCRVHNGKSIIIGFMFGGDNDHSLNGFIFLNNESKFCLYVPRDGNPIDEENNCAFNYNAMDDDDELPSYDEEKMIAEFEKNVPLK